MKKIFFVLVIISPPAITFSQGVDKTNLGFMAGLSVPVGSKSFSEIHKAGFNFNINVEHTFTKSLVIGCEFDFAKQNGTYTEILATTTYVKDDTYQFAALDAYMKLQNNLTAKNDFQFFLKAGGGFFATTVRKSLGGGGTTILLSPGVSYLTDKNIKITSAIEYRYNFGGNEWSASLLQFKVGFSFCLNPK